MSDKQDVEADEPESPGQYTCRSCTKPTWNDSEVCDDCEADAILASRGKP